MKKKWTGERLETFIFNSTAIEHLHRYALAQPFVKDKVVLDIACGEGYGSNLMAQIAKKTIGVDISKETISEAREKYKKSNLQFLEGSTSNIPCEDHSIDIVVSFETIEHHDQHEKMIEEILRVLKPEGLLIMSSPDKFFYSIVRNHENPFHVKELFEDEFKRLILKYFRFQIFFSQNSGFYSVVLPEKQDQNQKISGYSGDYENIVVDKSIGSLYWITIASNFEIPPIEVHPLFNGNTILDLQLKTIKEQYQNSFSYKIGNRILIPLSFIKKIWKWLLSRM